MESDWVRNDHDPNRKYIFSKIRLIEASQHIIFSGQISGLANKAKHIAWECVVTAVNEVEKRDRNDPPQAWTFPKLLTPNKNHQESHVKTWPVSDLV